MFISKKANLILDITREAVIQYVEQLKASIEKSKNDERVKNSKDKYECRVTRAENNLRNVEEILRNFGESMFDGRVTGDGTIIVSNCNETKQINMLTGSREQLEETIAAIRSTDIFREIGITTADIRLANIFREKGKTAESKGTEITGMASILCRKMAQLDGYFEKLKKYKQSMGKWVESRFQEDPKTPFDDLTINNTLFCDMEPINANTSSEIPTRYKLSAKRILKDKAGTVYKQYSPLVIDADRIGMLIDLYLNKEFELNNYTKKEKSEVISDLFNTLSKGFDIDYDEQKYIEGYAKSFEYKEDKENKEEIEID